MRHHPKLDANQPRIVRALRRSGAFVQSLASVGGGCPDLLVSFRNSWYVIEVKDGSKPPSARARLKGQIEWALKARAHVHVVLTPRQALAAIGAL